jgi:flagellar biosynthesis protein FlhB
VSEQTGEKTEQPSARRLTEAQNRGQIARSPEVQTAFVLMAIIGAFSFTGRELWQTLAMTLSGSLSHLHDTPLSVNAMPGYALHGALVFLRCTAPIVIAAMLGGLLAGGVQNRFNTAPEALAIQWERLSPAAGFQRVFSTRSAMAAAVALLKFILVFSLTFSVVKQVLNDPVFTSSVSLNRFMEFLASSCLKICLRILLAMGVIASADYGYQYWQTNRDLMMTKQEVKDEMKNTEGNPQIKARQRRQRQRTKRQMLAEVPKADVVVTNPTHYAVALRYDRKTMQAPRLIAKGIRKNALEIREIAQQAGVPIVENKPLARLMFKYGKVGQEIPSQLYVAVAEVLAYVYRTNPYRYYAASCADSAPNPN